MVRSKTLLWGAVRCGGTKVLTMPDCFPQQSFSRGGGLVRTISISKLIHSPPLGQSKIFLEL